MQDKSRRQPVAKRWCTKAQYLRVLLLVQVSDLLRENRYYIAIAAQVLFPGHYSRGDLGDRIS